MIIVIIPSLVPFVSVTGLDLWNGRTRRNLGMVHHGRPVKSLFFFFFFFSTGFLLGNVYGPTFSIVCFHICPILCEIMINYYTVVLLNFWFLILMILLLWLFLFLLLFLLFLCCWASLLLFPSLLFGLLFAASLLFYFFSASLGSFLLSFWWMHGSGHQDFQVTIQFVLLFLSVYVVACFPWPIASSIPNVSSHQFQNNILYTSVYCIHI